MYTDCPACSKEFEILATHLKAANGVVRCGNCGMEFNALTRLYDTPKDSTTDSLNNDEDNLQKDSNNSSMEEELTIQDQTTEYEIENGMIDGTSMESSEQISLSSNDDSSNHANNAEDNQQSDSDNSAMEEELTIQDQTTEFEFENGKIQGVSRERNEQISLDIETDAEEEAVGVELDTHIDDGEVVEQEATIEDEIILDDYAQENTLEGIEEVDIEEEVILDAGNVEEIQESVNQIRQLIESETGEDEVFPVHDEEVDTNISLKNEIADIEGDVDPELKALTELLDEVDEYIPEPDFDLGRSNNTQQFETKDNVENLITDTEEENKTEEFPDQEQHDEPLSIKADEIDVINEAIERIQGDSEQVAKELPESLIAETASSAEPVPELLQEQRSNRNVGMLLFWTMLSIVALLFAFLQAAWFQRDFLLGKYPEYYPQAKQVCDEINKRKLFDCKLRRYKDLSRIQIKERDVRLHPEFENTLLINASMINTGELAQDFPNIQLILFGDTGEDIAFVEIFPDDYLDNSIDKKLGMQPDIPVHFILEVNGEIESANSFEFHFF